MTTKESVDPIFTREFLAKMRAHYIGNEDPLQPLLSPALTADLRGLPPLLIQVGSHELLLDDATRLAVRAAAADVAIL